MSSESHILLFAHGQGKKHDPESQITARHKPLLIAPQWKRILIEGVGARLLWSDAKMAESEYNVSVPHLNSLLQMDPYLKPFEKDFQRR